MLSFTWWYEIHWEQTRESSEEVALGPHWMSKKHLKSRESSRGLRDGCRRLQLAGWGEHPPPQLGEQGRWRPDPAERGRLGSSGGPLDVLAAVEEGKLEAEVTQAWCGLCPHR